MPKNRTVAARDLQRLDFVRDEQGRWHMVGHLRSSWGVVTATDMDDEFIGSWNHGDPVSVKR